MDHLLVYADGDKVEEIEDWSIACQRFTWLTQLWPEVSLQKWDNAREQYKTMAHYQQSPVATMEALRTDYRRRMEDRLIGNQPLVW